MYLLRKRSLSISLILVFSAVATCALLVESLASVLFANSVKALPFEERGNRLVVGSLQFVDRPQSGGVPLGVLADLKEDLRSVRSLGVVFQQRANVRSSRLEGVENITYVSPELAALLPLAAGTASIQDTGVLVSPSYMERGLDGSGLGTQIQVGNSLMTVVGILRNEFSMPGFTKSSMVIAPSINRTARGEGKGVMIAELSPDVSISQVMAEAKVSMERIGRVNEADRGSRLRLISATEFGLQVLGSLFALAIVLAALIISTCLGGVVALAIYLWTRQAHNISIRRSLGASEWQATREFWVSIGGAVILGLLCGSLLQWQFLKLAQALSPWRIRWPQYQEVIFAALSLFGLFFVCFFVGWAIVTVLGRDRYLGTKVLLHRDTSVNGRARWAAIALLGCVSICLGASIATIPIDRQLSHLLTKPLGVKLEKVFLVAANQLGPSITVAEATQRWNRISNEVLNDPQVECVSLADSPPLTAEIFPYQLRPIGQAAASLQITGRHVDSQYFSCLGIDLIHGDFERLSTRVPVALSKKAAARLYPGVNPIGKVLTSQYSSRKELEVVAVVADSHQVGLSAGDTGIAFLPITTLSPETLILKTKSAMRTSDVSLLVRQRLNYYPDWLIDVRSLESLKQAQTLNERFHLTLFRTVTYSFGTLVVILLVSVLLADIAHIRKSLAIRSALGAPIKALLGVISWRYGVACTAGIPIGVTLGNLFAAYFSQKLGIPFVIWSIEHFWAVLSYIVVFSAVLCTATWPLRRLNAAKLLRE